MSHFFMTLLGDVSYTTVFFFMTLESSLFPVPAEAVLIPAGYLAMAGKLNLWIVLIAGTLGSMCGASINYLVGKYVGKPVLLKYGKYLLINHKKYHQAEALFLRNDRLYTFLGRLIPVIRHLISIPAGVFNMPYLLFVLITGAGAGLMSLSLLLLGYYFGQDVVNIVAAYTKEISIVVVIGLIIG